MTTATTIKVSRATRDRLKQGARAQGSTLEEYLLDLISERERRDRLQQMEAAWRATPEDVMRQYLAESAEWERAESERG
jgi:hypothetical protein